MTDFGNCLDISVGQSEFGFDRLGLRHEETHSLGAIEATRLCLISDLRERQGQDRNLTLLREPQPHAAGDEHLQSGAISQQIGHEGRCLDDLLEVVEKKNSAPRAASSVCTIRARWPSSGDSMGPSHARSVPRRRNRTARSLPAAAFTSPVTPSAAHTVSPELLTCASDAGCSISGNAPG